MGGESLDPTTEIAGRRRSGVDAVPFSLLTFDVDRAAAALNGDRDAYALP